MKGKGKMDGGSRKVSGTTKDNAEQRVRSAAASVKKEQGGSTGHGKKGGMDY